MFFEIYFRNFTIEFVINYKDIDKSIVLTSVEEIIQNI